MEFEILVSFNLTGINLNPEEVTALLSIIPTKTWRVDDLVHPKAGVGRKSNGWSLKSNLDKSAELDEQIKVHPSVWREKHRRECCREAAIAKCSLVLRSCSHCHKLEAEPPNPRSQVEPGNEKRICGLLPLIENGARSQLVPTHKPSFEDRRGLVLDVTAREAALLHPHLRNF
jgi:Domain of unknown function (DUF4279)